MWVRNQSWRRTLRRRRPWRKLHMLLFILTSLRLPPALIVPFASQLQSRTCRKACAMKSEAGMVVDEDAAFVAHWRMELEEIILRDFGPNAGGTEASGSVSKQRSRAEKVAQYIMRETKIPVTGYFFQGSSSRGTFLTVSHSHLSDFDVVLLSDPDWLRAKKADGFSDLAETLREYVVSSIGPDDLHYMGPVVGEDVNEFTLTEGRCGVELRLSLGQGVPCQDEATDFVLAYSASAEEGSDPGGIVVFDRMLSRWRKNNPTKLAAAVVQMEAKHIYYSLVVRMLKEWAKQLPRLRKQHAAPGATKLVKLLLVELPEEFGGGLERIVLEQSAASDAGAQTSWKQPITGLHIEMALCLQHRDFRDTVWAKYMSSDSNSLKPRTEEMLAHEPATPCAIDLLVGAVEHVLATLRIPIVTPGDDMLANEAILKDEDLARKTEDLLQELLVGLKKLQKEPGTLDAAGFLRSLLLRNPRHGAARSQEPDS